LGHTHASGDARRPRENSFPNMLRPRSEKSVSGHQPRLPANNYFSSANAVLASDRIEKQLGPPRRPAVGIGRSIFAMGSLPPESASGRQIPGAGEFPCPCMQCLPNSHGTTFGRTRSPSRETMSSSCLTLPTSQVSSLRVSAKTRNRLAVSMRLRGLRHSWRAGKSALRRDTSCLPAGPR